MVIGRTSRTLIDKNRMDTMMENDENRRIAVSIFYPAADDYKPETQAVYADLFYPCVDKGVEFMASAWGMDGNYLRKIQINSYNEAPINESKKRYPVVLYSPGFQNYRDFSIFNIEKIVEAGYIVITVGPTYESMFSIFPNGEFIPQMEEMDFRPEALVKYIDIRQWDLRFVMDQLDVLNKEDEILRGRLNIDNLGIVGFSLGGASIISTVQNDNRIKAAVNFDGFVPEIKDVSCPIMMLHSNNVTVEDKIQDVLKNVSLEQLDKDLGGGIEGKGLSILKEQFEGEVGRNQEFLNCVSRFKVVIKIKGTNHMSFADYPLVAPEDPGVKADIDRDRAFEIINTLSVGFLNAFLSQERGNNSLKLDNIKFPEVEILNNYLK